MKKYKKIMIGALMVILAGVGYYTLGPLFITVSVDDQLPDAFTQPLESGGSVYTMSGPFTVVGTAGHPAEGVVSVYEGDGTRFLRFEDFKTINGPQLHLYLAKDPDGKEFIDLGPIRGTEGDINYTLPDDVDIQEYPYVLHWCVPFGVLFNYADVSE